ncbi:MAG: hypothetical protein FJY77_03130 [Candidatus Altiarchaeales archaeon]|nr:hypothetical protein [Candidatus Altiarchaeales archaeon]
MGLFKSGFLDEVYYEYSERHQFVEMLLLAFLGFLIPFVFGHPQLLVGALVNAFLIRSALSLKSFKAIPIIFTPTLGVLARGILFGPFTVFIVYMMPFIWVGNYIIVQAFKVKLKHRLNYGLTLLAGSLLKAGFLYTTAFVFYSLGFIPQVFLTAMGVMQFTTAILGGVLVYLLLRIGRVL